MWFPSVTKIGFIVLQIRLAKRHRRNTKYQGAIAGISLCRVYGRVEAVSFGLWLSYVRICKAEIFYFGQV